jgi:hypothetical protein
MVPLLLVIDPSQQAKGMPFVSLRRSRLVFKIFMTLETLQTA